MERRPKLILKLKKTDKIIEFLGWASLIAIWVLTIINYSILPEIIPTHYNGKGIADNFGGKANILTLPLISTVLYIGMTILNNFPHLFNYPVKITAYNAIDQYKRATRLVRYLKLIIVLIFGLIAFNIIESANGEADGLGVWYLPFILGLIFIPLIYFIVKSFKKTKD
jgi:uncharacterized membrane protein